jgi:hypothetical protein
MIVLSLCDWSGVMVLPWAEAGYRCVCVDIERQDSPLHPNITHIAADIREVDPPAVETSIVFAFPPCTDLAVSGARWFRSKGWKRAASAVALVARCEEIAEATGAPYMIENPVSRLSSFHKPDHYFHPWHFTGYEGGEDDHYTKKTCLWTGGGFVMPPTRTHPKWDGVKPDDRIHKEGPSPDRARIRSMTPRGFARAVFETNATLQGARP